MDPRAALINIAWGASNLGRFARFVRALRDPRTEQRQLLARYLSQNAGTLYGRCHGFGSIRSPREYQSRVPLTTFDDYLQLIDRIASGEANVLTRDPVRRFVPTSGSTQAEKLVPHTATLQSEFNAAIGPWIVDLYRSDPRLAGGPAYWSVTPVAQPDESTRPPSAVPVGFDDDSAYLGGTWQRLVDATLAVPGDVRHVPDMAAFRYVTLLFLLRARELRLISVWHPSFLALLLSDIAPHWDSLLCDLAEGTCTPPAPVPADVAARLARRLRPEYRKARRLARVVPTDFARLWPRLRLISCWADAHAQMHADELRRLFPGVRVQPKGLIATEAFVTLPFAGKTPLAVRSHFFEFLSDDGRAHLAHELDLNGEYAILVTTGGGLYRYQLNDRVRVDGFVGRTPSLRFVGKNDNVSDRFGEKLSEGFVAGVLRDLFARFALRPRFAMLAPEEQGGRSCYVLFIEADDRADGFTTALGAALGAALDEALSANPHYRYCRQLGQLGPAGVFRVKGDAYAAYVARCRQRGQRVGNVKPSPLSRLSGWTEAFM